MKNHKSGKKIALIAGAGPAGLTAAYELLERSQIKPIIFESTNTIGGIAQTFNYKGNRIDIGGHRFFSKNERVMKWWFNLLPLDEIFSNTLEIGFNDPRKTSSKPQVIQIDEKFNQNSGRDNFLERLIRTDIKDRVMLKRSRLSRIFYKHNFFPYPLGINLIVAYHLGLWNTFLIGLSYIRAQVFPIKDEKYLDAFFINRFGYRLYKTFFKDYTEKIWGVKCSEILSEWGAQRVKGLSLKRAVSHAIKDLFSDDFYNSQQRREISLITEFYYPKYGPGQMWEMCAKEVLECGGEIHFKHEVVGIELVGEQVRKVKVKNLITNEISEFNCDYFFSTMPIKQLANIILPPLPKEVLTIANNLQYRDFLTVGLLLKKLHIKEKGKQPVKNVLDNWIYIQEGNVKVGRVQIFNNWSPYLVADKDTVWIGLEYFVNETDDFWSYPDEKIISFGISEMEKINFINAADVLDACVLRMPKAYPAYFGSYNQLNVIKDYVNKIPNLFLIGRNGMHRYNNQDHSMLTAMCAVDNIISGINDKSNIWDINLEMEYHEEK